jgi:hypothetical protein
MNPRYGIIGSTSHYGRGGEDLPASGTIIISDSLISLRSHSIPMAQIIGQSGRLTLNDSYIKFENWNIYVNNVGLIEWSGNFEIQKSDFFRVFPLVAQQVNADFYGNKNYNGEIIINGAPCSPSDDPVVVHFRGTGELRNLL